jgi:hypothetical protein
VQQKSAAILYLAANTYNELKLAAIWEVWSSGCMESLFGNFEDSNNGSNEDKGDKKDKLGDVDWG